LIPCVWLRLQAIFSENAYVCYAHRHPLTTSDTLNCHLEAQ